MELLEKIKIFKRLAEKGSFSAVAAEWGMGQPTVSKAIAQLEKELEVSLFRRSTRGLALTEEGQKLLARGTPLLDQWESVLASLKNEKLLLQGQIRVTVSLAFARLILMPLMDRFSEIHPELRFHFHLSDGFVDLIENGVDLAIRIGELEDSNLKALKIGQMKRSLYASKEYLKKFGAPKNIEALRKHRLVLYTRNFDAPCWPLVGRDGKEMLFHFEPYLQADGSDLMRESILAGIGIGLVPTWAMMGPEKEKTVVRLLEKKSYSTQPIYAVTSGNREMTAKQRAVADFLKREFAKIPALSV
jgi:LysR family transcriptional regulator for bpeEF and oprC